MLYIIHLGLKTICYHTVWTFMKMITKTTQTKDKSNDSDTTPTNAHVCKLAIFSYHIVYTTCIYIDYSTGIYICKPCKFYSFFLFNETSVIYILQMIIEFNICISPPKIIGISLYSPMVLILRTSNYFESIQEKNCILFFQYIQDKYRSQYIHTKYVKHFVFSVLC